jgi:hypothetical protein
MTLHNKKLLCLESPWWVKDWINKFSGIKTVDASLSDIVDAKPSLFVTYEEFLFVNKTNNTWRHSLVMENTKKLFQIMEQHNLKGMIFFILHIYKLSETIMAEIDRLSVGKNISIICMSFMPYKFKNVKVYTADMVEEQISHDFNFLLSTELQKRRKPFLDFMLLTVIKDNFRKKVSDALARSDVTKNSLIIRNSSKEIVDFKKKQEVLFEDVRAHFPDGYLTNALRTWQGFLPNLNAYEKIFCEIVIESSNEGEYCDVSEKTYRPIAMGVPFVFLGSKQIFDKLKNDGYTFFGQDFYDKWHLDIDLEKKIPFLIDFLKVIASDNKIQNEMEQIAKQNHQHFWTVRKTAHRKKNYITCKDCFGQTGFDKLYERLNF